MTQMNRSYENLGVGQRELFSEETKIAMRFFNMVYAWMAAGLAVTALVAAVVSQRPTFLAWVYNPVSLIGLFIAQIALVVIIRGAVNRVSAPAATVLFMVYSALMGLTLASIFLIYSHATIVGAFMATAGTFAATSVYGMVTRRDLSQFGSLMFMALIGLIIASVVNIFLASNALYWIITYAGVLIFVGLTAYRTQELKQIAYATANNAHVANRLAVSGALSLYLAFINLFLFILRLLGDRR